MKKFMLTLLVIGLTALSALAWPFGRKSSDDEQNTAPQTERLRDRAEDRRGERPRMSPEKREAMKAQREAIMALGEAARTATDPAQKEKLIGQLRAELEKGADKMQQMHEKRLQQAEEQLEKLRARMDEAQANRSQMIEKQIERILSGEKPEPPEGGRRFGRPPEE